MRTRISIKKGKMMWKNIWNPSNRKVLCCNIVTALILNLFLEYMERKSLDGLMQFINDRTFVFLFNALIIFMFLSVVFVARKKLFTYSLISAGWFLVGLVNGIVLNDRKTPFTAVDLTLAKSILPILQSYLELWQIVGAVLLIIAGVIALVCLYLYSPVAKKSFDMKTNACLVMLMLALFFGVTYVGVGRGQLISDFDNLIAGYKDYGVAYGFCVTAMDTGIDRPIEYSKDRVNKVNKKMQKKLEESNVKSADKEERHPNIIFIQLESFFDLSTVKDLQVSEDPIPTFHKIQEEYTSGMLKVPVYGAGTINTEFEVITGMNVKYFGTGEYPYRSVLQNKTCDSVAYWLKEFSYETSVIHNNNASFYDRDHVFSNLGFDNFITIENMNVKSTNEAGWAKDEILTQYIMDTLEKTTSSDLIYTISVQGHGDYPSSSQEDAQIKVTGEGFSESYLNQLTYYVNQTREMDDFLKGLLELLSEYDEDTMVIAYGDHLPGMDFENADLECGNKYETPYFIWDNFGYNKANKNKESGDLSAYQLASKVLGEVNIQNGVLNQYHQTMTDSKNYQKNLKLLEYDMLYGADFSRADIDPLEPTDICFSLNPVKIESVKQNGKKYLLLGENFNEYSRVYVNGIQVNATKKSNKVLEISAGSVKDGDEITVHQVSKTNENITLNQSEVYEFYLKNVRPLYKERAVAPNKAQLSE